MFYQILIVFVYILIDAPNAQPNPEPESTLPDSGIEDASASTNVEQEAQPNTEMLTEDESSQDSQETTPPQNNVCWTSNVEILIRETS